MTRMVTTGAAFVMGCIALMAGGCATAGSTTYAYPFNYSGRDDKTGVPWESVSFQFADTPSLGQAFDPFYVGTPHVRVEFLAVGVAPNVHWRALAYGGGKIAAELTITTDGVATKHTGKTITDNLMQKTEFEIATSEVEAIALGKAVTLHVRHGDYAASDAVPEYYMKALHALWMRHH